MATSTKEAKKGTVATKPRGTGARKGKGERGGEWVVMAIYT